MQKQHNSKKQNTLQSDNVNTYLEGKYKHFGVYTTVKFLSC